MSISSTSSNDSGFLTPPLAGSLDSTPPTPDSVLAKRINRSRADRHNNKNKKSPLPDEMDAFDKAPYPHSPPPSVDGSVEDDAGGHAGGDQVVPVTIPKPSSEGTAEPSPVGSAPSSRGERRVFVGGIPYASSEAEVGIFLGDMFGAVAEVKFIYDAQSAKFKGYGFVLFRDAASATAARDEGFVPFEGRTLNIGKAVRNGTAQGGAAGGSAAAAHAGKMGMAAAAAAANNANERRRSSSGGGSAHSPYANFGGAYGQQQAGAMPGYGMTPAAYGPSYDYNSVYASQAGYQAQYAAASYGGASQWDVYANAIAQQSFAAGQQQQQRFLAATAVAAAGAAADGGAAMSHIASQLHAMGLVHTGHSPPSPTDLSPFAAMAAQGTHTQGGYYQAPANQGDVQYAQGWGQSGGDTEAPPGLGAQAADDGIAAAE